MKFRLRHFGYLLFMWISLGLIGSSHADELLQQVNRYSLLQSQPSTSERTSNRLQVPPLSHAVFGELFWHKTGKDILHSMAGDDFQAFFGYSPKFDILNSPSLDAFVARNGTLVISTGLLSLVDSTPEFAYIVAHEVAHVLLGHHQHVHPEGTQANSLYNKFLEQELAADRLAIKLLNEAGYNPAVALSFLGKLRSFGAESGFSLDRLYPSLVSRQQVLEDLLGDEATLTS